MTPLSSIPFADLRVGDRVISARTGREGFISNKVDISKAIRFEDNEVVIRWDNGNISHHWHFQYDIVHLI